MGMGCTPGRQWLRQIMVADLMLDHPGGNIKLLTQVMDYILLGPPVSEARAQGFCRCQEFCREGPGLRLAHRIHGRENAQSGFWPPHVIPEGSGKKKPLASVPFPARDHTGWRACCDETFHAAGRHVRFLVMQGRLLRRCKIKPAIAIVQITAK